VKDVTNGGKKQLSKRGMHNVLLVQINVSLVASFLCPLMDIASIVEKEREKEMKWQMPTDSIVNLKESNQDFSMFSIVSIHSRRLLLLVIKL
jgi:hypothetical protein